MSEYDLVIFDCDGVLIDSERLAVRTERRILAELGWALTDDEIIERFVGRSSSYMLAEVERQIGRSVNWSLDFEAPYQEVFRAELLPIDGVVDALNDITQPTCIASSSSHEMLKFKLELTNLYDRFVGNIFSAQDVAHGKPAPDVFLFAAERMGAQPSRCAVIEDSVSGVEAGVSAGMTVFAFGGGVTRPSLLARDGVMIFMEMSALPSLLRC
jgi:HAD superfamily hydrolase (TIGR01509 family)